mgnify:CR=1 FL=1
MTEGELDEVYFPHVIIVSVGTDHLHLLIIEPSGAFAALVGAWNLILTCKSVEDHDEACDYFDFIDNELQGATAEEMRVARNNGLHFRVCDNSYYYTIPIKDGDPERISTVVSRSNSERSFIFRSKVRVYSVHALCVPPSPEIYNIVACRDYMLGVSEDVRVACNAESAELHIITRPVHML